MTGLVPHVSPVSEQTSPHQLLSVERISTPVGQISPPDLNIDPRLSDINAELLQTLLGDRTEPDVDSRESTTFRRKRVHWTPLINDEDAPEIVQTISYESDDDLQSISPMNSPPHTGCIARRTRLSGTSDISNIPWVQDKILERKLRKK